MAAVQEMYSQYLSQYMQYMQTAAPLPQPGLQAVANEAEAERGRAPAAVMNAGAGGQPFADEEDQGRYRKYAIHTAFRGICRIFQIT